VTQQGAVRMVVYTPMDDATRDALAAGAEARRHRSL
jgi:hypothetical protein